MSASRGIPAGELPSLLWSSENLGYTIPEGEAGSCQKSKRRIRRSSSERRCGTLRPAESLTRCRVERDEEQELISALCHKGATLITSTFEEQSKRREETRWHRRFDLRD